jgi:hypothetical protein
MSTAIKSSTPIKKFLDISNNIRYKKLRLQAEHIIQDVPFKTGSLLAPVALQAGGFKWNILCYAFCNTSVFMAQLPFSS